METASLPHHSTPAAEDNSPVGDVPHTRRNFLIAGTVGLSSLATATFAIRNLFNNRPPFANAIRNSVEDETKMIVRDLHDLIAEEEGLTLTERLRRFAEAKTKLETMLKSMKKHDENRCHAISIPIAALLGNVCDRIADLTPQISEYDMQIAREARTEAVGNFAHACFTSESLQSIERKSQELKAALASATGIDAIKKIPDALWKKFDENQFGRQTSFQAFEDYTGDTAWWRFRIMIEKAQYMEIHGNLEGARKALLEASRCYNASSAKNPLSNDWSQELEAMQARLFKNRQSVVSNQG